MKHPIKTTLSILLFIALVPVFAFGQQTPPAFPACILSGEQSTLTGTVVSFERGSGLVISTDSGEVTLYGIGPERYWDKMGVDYPEVGETITAIVYTCPSTDRYVAFSITLDGDTIQLRDTTTGRPLWRGGAGRGQCNR